MKTTNTAVNKKNEGKMNFLLKIQELGYTLTLDEKNFLGKPKNKRVHWTQGSLPSGNAIFKEA